MRQTQPKPAQAAKAPNGVPWGNPQWGRTLDNPEELIRLREGSVDENGMRFQRKIYTKSPEDELALAQKEADGWKVTIEETGRWSRCEIPQEEWQRRENERIAITRARSRHKPDPAFNLRDERENLAPVTAQDVLAGNIPSATGLRVDSFDPEANG